MDIQLFILSFPWFNLLSCSSFQSFIHSELQSLSEQKRHLAEEVVAKSEDLSKLQESLRLSEKAVEDLTCQLALVEAKSEAANEANVERFQVGLR